MWKRIVYKIPGYLFNDVKKSYYKSYKKLKNSTILKLKKMVTSKNIKDYRRGCSEEGIPTCLPLAVICEVFK